MPIEPCFYCDKIAVCNLWNQACDACFRRYVLPLERAGVPFKSPRGSVRSYPPENWKEILERERNPSEEQ